jgi:hypothetical protein
LLCTVAGGEQASGENECSKKNLHPARVYFFTISGNLEL